MIINDTTGVAHGEDDTDDTSPGDISDLSRVWRTYRYGPMPRNDGAPKRRLRVVATAAEVRRKKKQRAQKRARKNNRT